MSCNANNPDGMTGLSGGVQISVPDNSSNKTRKILIKDALLINKELIEEIGQLRQSIKTVHLQLFPSTREMLSPHLRTKREGILSGMNNKIRVINQTLEAQNKVLKIIDPQVQIQYVPLELIEDGDLASVEKLDEQLEQLLQQAFRVDGKLNAFDLHGR